MSDFGGWGTREVVNVIDDAENVIAVPTALKLVTEQPLVRVRSIFWVGIYYFAA